MTPASPEAIVIGASAGALEALSAILPTLPRDFALPILIVVHVPPDRDSLLSELMRAKCRIPVKEAEDKEPIVAGTVYFAPPDYHLLVETGRTLALSSDEPVLFSRPSIDVLFESAADAYGPALLAIILTGANQDGARGLHAVVSCGGAALVQNPDGAFASAMPEAAILSVPRASVMSLAEIAVNLQTMQAHP
ncbi:MAG TPA: chemotaxis protein CheB [Mesorhizobium sp.]|jgi:two-component system chemotaxis response regulator CheB|uniref:chemotaxis protein CheB n=1 Tax=Mesorhizobium sp. TaxID=1871066 RepID=UPI002DDC929F|nr:chemotaxis protein CheB [Mesorhizobium sp.]HEV2503735.1 chemotaxis protein CheB [Mesorhizobium sp.]